MEIPQHIAARLARHQQQQLVRWWSTLSADEQQSLLAQIEAIDFELLDRLLRQRSQPEGTGGGESARDRAQRAAPPQQLQSYPRSDEARAAWDAAAARGLQLLREGRVGAILVAGGQGTRLGFDQPKGMFPIAPVSGKSLFQLFCEQLLARGQQAGRPIPYFIMTSDATHSQTLEYFQQHGNFGLSPDDVYFFQQGTLPAADDAQPRLLLAARSQVATSPDGHGGMLKALHRAGLLDVMQNRGIDYLYYHQVDNPTALLCDPTLLGLHVALGSEMSTKVVPKASAAERMGVLVSVDDRTEIIEYSDLPAERAEATAADGSLLLWAGNTAIHVFDRQFLARLVAEGHELPYHVAHKTVPCLDDAGTLVEPTAANAHKFEQFIFDALPVARRALAVEADRAEEFNPVKNREGQDSPATARAALLRNYRRWLSAAGARVAQGVRVEISPLFALDADEARTKVPPGTVFERDLVLETPDDVPRAASA